MAVTTGKGDNGTTDIFEGRISKDDLCIEYLGTLDELDAFLADVLLFSPAPRTREIIDTVRIELSTVLMPAAVGLSGESFTGTDTLEHFIRELDRPQKGFIRQWDCPTASKLNIARTICRRAERRMVTFTRSGGKQCALVYLNRLSDLLFLLAVFEASSVH